MSNLDSDSVIHRTGEQVSTKVEDKTVLLQLASGEYYALNPVGAELWERMETPQTVRALAEHLVEQYEVTFDTALGDVLELVESLKEAGFVVVPTP